MQDLESPPVPILIVDDQPANLLALESLLERADIRVLKAGSGNEALGIMLETDVALVLMDVQMPEMDGFETAELMRQSARTRHIPIIFVTAISKEEQHVFKGYESGAVDYLFKPIDPHILLSKVNVFLELRKKQLDLERTTRELNDMIDGLRSANRKIIEQQSALIEEERLKVLLQMAGATAHELNQPLTGLLGTIELIRLDRNDPEKLDRHLMRIEEAGNRISAIVKRMQGIQVFDTIDLTPPSESDALHPERMNLLWIEEPHRKNHPAEVSIIRQMYPNILSAASIREGMDRLESGEFDLVISRFRMADGTALDLLNWMNQKRYDAPLIVVAAKGDERIATQVLQAGAYDYVSLNHLSRKEWIERVNKALGRARIKKEARKAIQKMAELSTRDGLTGLYNRRYFTEALEREVARAIRRQSDLILCMFDIDHFKRINDTLGHQAGDMVLSTFGRLLTEWLRMTDIPCRYGGEEFAVILADTNKEQTLIVCDRFRNALSDHVFQYAGQAFHITASAGVASILDIFPRAPDSLVAAADQALYSAKNSGRNRVVLFEPSDKEKADAL